MRRCFDLAQPEWMDLPQPVTPELKRDLANLRSLNRWFGSYRLIRYFLSRWLKPNTEVRILDVATGSGDIPRLIADFARRRGVTITIDAIDQQESTVAIARELSRDYREITFTGADLFEWNPPILYDVVVCSLALHHFVEEDAIRALRKFRALSRGKVLVADLRRAWWLYLGVKLLTSLVYREPMTRNDARVSAAAAFSFAEMRELARKAGWQNFSQARFAFGRQAIWISS